MWLMLLGSGQQQTARLHLKVAQEQIRVSVMYAGRRRIGGGTDAHPAASPATTVVVVVAAAAVVVRIVVGAGRVGAARIAQPGVGAGRKVGVSLIGTGIVAQI